MRALKVLTVVTAVLVLAGGTVCAQIAPKPQNPTKWSQWVDVEMGYDAYSFWQLGNPAPTLVIADDWRCPDGLPVTDVHWWGSYIQGGPVHLPPDDVQLDGPADGPPTNPNGVLGFELSIHTDIPPDGIHPSHPGQLLWSKTYPIGPVQEVFYGPGRDHDIYQYYVLLPQEDWFPQEQGQIYWLDIIAIVPDNVQWGWHTGVRPQPDNTLDDAVIIYDYTANGTYTAYGELNDAQGSVAMAFELTTVPEPATFVLLGTGVLAAVGFIRRRRMSKGLPLLLAALVVLTCGTLSAQKGPPEPIKWIQPPDLDCGHDVISYWPVQRPVPIVAVADDWHCLDGLPVTDLHWWGSYPNGRPAAAPGVLGFEISVHTDIPAAGSTPSHPGTLIWWWNVPLNTQAPPTAGTISIAHESFFSFDNNLQAVYQYDLLLQPNEWFYQEQGNIYWLDIIARTASDNVTWGWHTAMRPGPENGLDAAVHMFDYNPVTGDYSVWASLYDRCHVQLAFEITTVPEPATVALVGSAALAIVGVIRRRRLR